MKLFLSVLLIIIFCLNFSLAQTGDLNIDLQKVQNTDNWELNLQYNFNNPPSNSILIELPANFKVTPISIQMDSMEMWLKNSADSSQNSSVVCWEHLESGLVLRFSGTTLQPASRLNMKCLAQTGKKIDNNTVLSIKPILVNNQISDEVISSNNLNIIR